MSKIRKNLINSLAIAWRYAENHYLETGSILWKGVISDIQDSIKLTDKEIKELENISENMGV